ncbi:MAG: 30S ribosomal protein S5 [Patescibacteria group bacterium]
MPRPREKREKREKAEFDQKTVDLRRVTRVVAGGRRFRFRTTLVIGDRNGRVGVGTAKGADVALSIDKAYRAAKKNIIKVFLKSGTIPHEVRAKFGPSEIILKPAAPGRGIIAGGAVRAVCELAGVKDITTKIVSRSPNKLNNAKATVEALKMLKKSKHG